ncbi:MAG: MauE/DoxX family redox-associated membrane protein [Brevundimonas sp.]
MYVRAFACLVLLGVFAVSSFGKGRSRAAFRGAVDAARHLTGRARPAPLVVLVLLGEAAVVVGMATGLALSSRVLTTGAALVAGCLLAAFTVALVAAVRRGESAPCHCLGGSTAQPAPRHVVRNAVLLVLVVVVVVATPVATSADVRGVLLSALVAAVVVGAVALLDDLADLFRPTNGSLTRSSTSRPPT